VLASDFELFLCPKVKKKEGFKSKKSSKKLDKLALFGAFLSQNAALKKDSLPFFLDLQRKNRGKVAYFNS
jgi:hypothetical protein